MRAIPEICRKIVVSPLSGTINVGISIFVYNLGPTLIVMELFHDTKQTFFQASLPPKAPAERAKSRSKTQEGDEARDAINNAACTQRSSSSCVINI